MNLNKDFGEDCNIYNNIKVGFDFVYKVNGHLSDNVFIIHQNVRSLRANFNTLVSHLEIFKKLPDFTFISETWIFNDEVNSYFLPDYNFYTTTNENFTADGGVDCLGDFNINVLGKSSIISDFLTQLAIHGLVSVINEPTRLASGSCLDHICIRLFNSIPVSYEIMDFEITDHCMCDILLEYNSNSKRSNFNNNSFILKTDYKKLNSYLRFAFWESVYLETSISKAFEKLIQILNN